MQSSPRSARSFRVWYGFTGAITALVATVMIGPTIIVLLLSFSSGSAILFPPSAYSLRWYINLATSEPWLRGARDSIIVAASASVIATVLGSIAAIGIGRSKSRLSTIALAAFVAPLIFPTVVVAVGTYLVFLNWKLAGGYLSIVLAHSVLGFPFVVINVLASYRAMDQSLELAAHSLGAGRVRTFIHVIVPAVLPGVATGALFAFVTSWDEVIIALFLSSPQTRTLPVVMWSQLRSSVDPTIAAAASTLTAITTILLLVYISTQRTKGLFDVIQHKPN